MKGAIKVYNVEIVKEDGRREVITTDNPSFVDGSNTNILTIIVTKNTK
jgi:hypothetical protein